MLHQVLDEGVSHSVTPLWCAAVSGRLRKDDSQKYVHLKNEKRVTFNSNTDIFTWPLFLVIVRSSETKARRVVLQKYSNYSGLALGVHQLMETGMEILGWEYDPCMCDLDQRRPAIAHNEKNYDLYPGKQKGKSVGVSPPTLRWSS
jgi:hypothetical protein